MSATWYDVLGVDPTATADEIRAAWKQAIADLEPTDRRFRACNQAAEVLLDPERRAAYDAELGPAADEPVVGDQPAAYEPTPPVDEPQPSGPAPERGPSAVRTVPTRALVVLAALTATLAVLAAIVQFAVDPPASSAEDQISEARDAATESMPVLFSYDYRTAEADRDQALRRTTGCFHDQLQEVWDEALLPSIRQAKGVAKSSVKASGVVRASGGRRPRRAPRRTRHEDQHQGRLQPGGPQLHGDHGRRGRRVAGRGCRG